MNKDKSSFIPDWIETAPKEKSYRSIFKWGDPKGFKHPNKALYDFMKKTLGLTDDDFQKRENEGHEKVVCHDPVKLDVKHIEAIKAIVGPDNVTDDDYSRVKYSSGMTMIEVDMLRRKGNKSVADIVVHPRHKEDVQKIVTYCHCQLIPIYAYGGGSSVNFGHMPVKGGISLVMKTHMNKIVWFSETDHTVRVQAGMMGPAFEDALNKAPENFSAQKRHTCGHFPQSFEYSSVGGWVLTLGSGQQSSYYGDAYDLVFSQEFVTPTGQIKTLDYAATATGPKLNDIMKGSEGSYGILTELTMKVFHYMPENQNDFAFIFSSWEDAVNATREVSQGEFGMPSVFRISDPEETTMGLKLYGVEGTILDKLIQMRGYKSGKRCLLIGHTEGEKGFSNHVKKMVKRFVRNMALCISPVTP